MKTAFLILGVLALNGAAAAQCAPAWSAVANVQGAPTAMLRDLDSKAYGPFYVANIHSVGSAPMHDIARHYRGAWSALGTGLTGSQYDDIEHLAMWTDAGGTPPLLHVGGNFDSIGGLAIHNIARWSGSQWEALGQESSRNVRSLAVYDDDHEGPGAPYLYRGASSPASQPTDIALLRWDGAVWSPMPVPLAPDPPTNDAQVLAMCIFDDDLGGPRPEGLYVGGTLGGGGGVVCYNIVRWNGVAWEGLDLGVNSSVYSMAVFDDDDAGPRAPALFVGGAFSWAGGVNAWKFARWDGHQWSAVDNVYGGPKSMVVFDDDGSGPRPPGLFLTGSFLYPGSCIAKYNGWQKGWDQLGSGLTGGPAGPEGWALGVYDEDGPGPNPGGLYVGGDFGFAGGVPASCIARWGCPLPPGGPCYADCDQDGALTLPDFACFHDQVRRRGPLRRLQPGRGPQPRRLRLLPDEVRPGVPVEERGGPGATEERRGGRPGI
ncbi:MAG: hypothetical protein IT437_08130 [Phycisphaerales bacterium]|nr:hypothetical protein [Phycisphaerales bacterium]